MTHRNVPAGGGSRQSSTYSDSVRPISVFRLKFDPEGERPAKDVEFEAEDAARALIIAHREARRRSAELWRDGKKLCSIRRQSSEVWEIVSAHDHLLDNR